MTHGDFEVRGLDSRWMYTDDEGNDHDVVKEISDNKMLRSLLELAKCPDDNCDGKGTCSQWPVPGYDGEADIDIWECRWCAERALVLNRNDT